MASDSSFATAPRFRQRKISLKQQLRILWERDLPSNVEDVRGDLLGIVETGVDKSEEDERHLQAVLSAATTAGNAQDAYIPTPKATTKWGEYSKYYKPGWIESETYIRSSATVEDAQGNEYNMDEEDLDYLEKINEGFTDSKAKCTEDEFETICTLVEAVVAEKQPFLSMDPEQLLPYEDLEQHVLNRLEERRLASKNPLDPERLLLEAQSRDYAPKLLGAPHRSTMTSVKTFGKQIYDHWRQRKIARKGKSIFPTLRSESGLASDDSDPYVCFRHREVRHSRKTRRTDQQNSGRLRKLHSEMQDAQSIFELILKRERKRLQQIQTDFEIFELRCRVKAVKRKLKIGPEQDDVSLLVSVPKRVRQEEQAKQRRDETERQRRAQLAKEKAEREREKREASRDASRDSSRGASSTASAEARRSTAATAAGSRIPDLEHVTVAQQGIERSMALEQAVMEKLAARREADKGWVNATDSLYVPYVDYFRSPLLSPPSTPDGDAEANFQDAADAHAMDVEPVRVGDEPRHRQPPNADASFDKPDSLSNLLSSAIELPHSRAVDIRRQQRPRLPLPTDNVGSSDSPEIVSFDGTSRKPVWYTDVDFQLRPNQFSVPRDAPQAVCRRRTFGNTVYIDRVLPVSANPLARFGRELAKSSAEEDERLADRYLFDNELEDSDAYLAELCDDPARLNGIGAQTQNLRFSSMLTAKSNELLIEVQQQRRRQVQLMARRQQMQQQQRAAAEAQAQQNAQMQTQNSLRLQQSQRAAQRQQQRKRPSVPGKENPGRVNGTAGKAPNAVSNASSPGAGKGNGTGHANGHGQANPRNGGKGSRIADARADGATKGLANASSQSKAADEKKSGKDSQMTDNDKADSNGEMNDVDRRMSPHPPPPKVEASV